MLANLMVFTNRSDVMMTSFVTKKGTESEKKGKRRRKAWFVLRICRTSFAAKHKSQAQLDDIAHERTIVCSQLFAGYLGASRSMKRKKNSTE